MNMQRVYAKQETNLYNQITVMVIDDSRFSTKIFEINLKKIHIPHILIANNGLEALNIMRQSDKHIHLIFLDINMPQMDGIEFLRHLVSLKFSGGIIITSCVDDSIIAMVKRLSEAHHLNCLGHIQKNASYEELKAIIDAYIQQEELKLSIIPDFIPRIEDILAGIRDGQFINYYQTKVSIHSEKTIGCEVLARWQHPKFGLIYPRSFIPVLTQSQQTLTLAKAIISQAMQDLALLVAIKPEIKLSFNCTIQDLNWLELPQYLSEQAQLYGINPNQVMLEITETELPNNPTTALEILSRLRLYGFKLSIDDFGTGFSNLEKLQLIKFDEIKIDRMFVHNAHLNPTTQAILKSSCALGKNLNMLITAEGAENRADRDNLLSLGVDLVQGYYYSRPLPLKDIVAILKNE